MSIYRTFRTIVGIGQNPSAFVQLRPEMLHAIDRIAEQNGSTISEVANELISNALHDHQLAANSLQTWQQLTRREREITALIWLDLSNTQIAERLSISPNTVKTHIRNILNKFNVHSKKSLTSLLTGLDLSDWVDSPNGANP